MKLRRSSLWIAALALLCISYSAAADNDATTAGGYTKGLAVFTVAKGGLMYKGSLGGQKFSYKPVAD